MKIYQIPLKFGKNSSYFMIDSCTETLHSTSMNHHHIKYPSNAKDRTRTFLRPAKHAFMCALRIANLSRHWLHETFERQAPMVQIPDCEAFAAQDFGLGDSEVSGSPTRNRTHSAGPTSSWFAEAFTAVIQHYGLIILSQYTFHYPARAQYLHANLYSVHCGIGLWILQCACSFIR